ncbi:uncharacterized protein OCT59_022548 [Rhizophagus irregularis]|uniref:Uncharacterized protein n=1 Tax=Rhizophagus irregularis (strain DAOM 181602 / DAOM 197198 / MUCL 43194) TaxID=747089 RepID=A0A2P4Q9S2_RHIID|nr:hypothetical protein GLOIN_2v1049188 [Rhizophagus irregularis DAOM 181602=DAOM 197198]POG74399.1 hypothetical protein GLOIN_2v1049188 [Rhizophagus irregularis DAOM 181602=DAOM 197198]UZO29053.1 hypothetical protein OCT59_022548 [Rhizophagus irregularis]GBC50952.2 hypothetical protein GLOIN_2v1049188 [Rhizophagus irregularis DAOM 181602=DAOM 197198]|eukprot:XP_025181265.1 hypothetical protein GLOIN_2v1049188 [Rhizophagus irregularis DAOM 181602=DAOM 197198]
MVEPLPTIFLDENGSSKNILVLDHKYNKFLSIKISTAREIYDRNYIDILNSYMIFSIDCCSGFNLAKSNKNYKQFSYSPKDIPLFWENSPKDVKDEYEKIYIGFRKFKPKVKKFVMCDPLEKNEKNFSKTAKTKNSGGQLNIDTTIPSDLMESIFNYVEENGIIPNSDPCHSEYYSLYNNSSKKMQ